ncbi:MAG: nucleotidyltransferase family protein, partial [Gammaproteobacteria bacterium]|nr:nucleotidyltransferase family protein [Gammaproteobacteria bacterium]
MLEIVILAAGASTRLGKSKQLLKINDEPLVCKIASIATKLTDNFKLKKSTVIVGKDALQVEKALDFSDVQTVYNEQWKDGMGTSVATAAKNLKSDSTAILLMTCDQVLITYEALVTLIQYWHLNPEKIIASSYNNTLGIPVIFP